MGTWGAGLYQDDLALDFQSLVSLIAKVPGDGDRILDILITQLGEVPGVGDSMGRTFWLVVADQFERRGLRSQRVSENALSIIEAGSDIEALREHVGNNSYLSKRRSVLDSLRSRLNSPRPLRQAAKSQNPPRLAVLPGQVYTFPTMAFVASSGLYTNWEQEQFVPNGWGALIVVETGYAFGWLPWCTVASLAVPRDRPGTLDEVIGASTLINGRFKSPAVRCIPKSVHFKRMKAELIGTFELNPCGVEAFIASAPDVAAALDCGWSVGSVIFGYSPAKSLGPRVSELIRRT